MIITNLRYALVGYFITSYPTRAHGIIVIYSRDVHAYNTRNNDLRILRLPLATITKYQSSFHYNRAKAWNDLPYNLRIENSLSKLKNGLKLHNLVAEVELMTYIVDIFTSLFVSKS